MSTSCVWTFWKVMLSNPHWCLGSQSKERWFFSLLLGIPCTTCPPPPSVVGEAGGSTDTGTEVWTVEETERGSERERERKQRWVTGVRAWAPTRTRPLLSRSWSIWFSGHADTTEYSSPAAPEALTPWCALRNSDQWVNVRLRVTRKSSWMVTLHQWPAVIHISFSLCIYCMPRSTSFHTFKWFMELFSTWSCFQSLVLSKVKCRVSAGYLGFFILSSRFVLFLKRGLDDDLLVKALLFFFSCISTFNSMVSLHPSFVVIVCPC